MAATIEDVAERANVSAATVSRALRGLPNVAAGTRDRVQRAARALDYVADPHAARLAGRRSATVGVVVPVLGWYHARVFTAAQAVFSAHDLDSLPYVLSCPADRGRFVSELPFRKRVDGVLLVDIPFDPEQLRAVVHSGTAVVGLGLDSEILPTLTVDNRAAARSAVGHLVSLGHRRIGLIGGSLGDHPRFPVPVHRRDGYERALEEAGIAADESLVCPAEFTCAGGAHAMQELLGLEHPPTAVFAMSDEMAVGAIGVARDAGLRIPSDLSVVGFDDHDVAEYVGLTTVRQDVGLQGEQAARLLLEALPGPERSPPAGRLPTRLVVRTTTAPPPAG